MTTLNDQIIALAVNLGQDIKGIDDRLSAVEGAEGSGSTVVQADWTATTGPSVILHKPTIPTVPALATVATSGAYADLTGKPTIPVVPSLALVATSGVYSDLSGKPVIPAAQIPADWNATSGMAAIANKPTLATVATSGSYNDLTDKPVVAGLPTLATVATSGAYADLTGKPTIPAAQVQSDWNATTGAAEILNKPTIPTVPALATVATSGNYADLNGKPTIPTVPALATVATSGAYADLTGKPVIPTLPSLATVATSGAYADLSGKPSIPAAQVQSDWNAATGAAAILNKPTIPTVPALATVATSGLYSDLQSKPTLAAVAVSGAYADLTGKPTIPSAAVTMTASGTGHAGGLVPDPGPTAGTTRFLREDGTFAVPAGGSSSTPTGSIRNIATRCRHDYQYYTGSNLVSCVGRSQHVNMGDAVFGPQVVLGNWIANNTGEITPTGGAITEMISIEYPAGEYTMASWDTANNSATRTETISIPAGGADVVSDPIPVFIPKGHTFWIRRWCRFTSGTAAQFPISANAVASGGDTAFVGFAADNTTVANADSRSFLTGTAVAGTTVAMAQMRYPLAILGMSTVASALLIGDSRCSGRSDSNATTISNNPIANALGSADWGRWGYGEIARSIGHARPYTNLGCETDAVGGTVGFAATHTFRARQQAYHTDVICQYGVNDVNLAGRTAAVTETTLTSVYNLFPTKRVWQSTIAPVSTSTDSWATVANQTTASINPQRTALNDWIRTTPAPLVGYFEVADVLETARNSGIWNVVTGLGAPSGDGLHETPAYYKLIDTSKAVDPSRLTSI